MRVVLPAPDTPMRAVSTPGRKAPLMPHSSSSTFLPSISLMVGSFKSAIACTRISCSAGQATSLTATTCKCSAVPLATVSIARKCHFHLATVSIARKCHFHLSDESMPGLTGFQGGSPGGGRRSSGRP